MEQLPNGYGSGAIEPPDAEQIECSECGVCHADYDLDNLYFYADDDKWDIERDEIFKDVCLQCQCVLEEERKVKDGIS